MRSLTKTQGENYIYLLIINFINYYLVFLHIHIRRENEY